MEIHYSVFLDLILAKQKYKYTWLLLFRAEGRCASLPNLIQHVLHVTIAYEHRADA